MWCGNSQIARLGTCISTNFLKQALILGPIRCVQLTQWTLLDQMWVLTIMMLVQYWRELRWWSIIQRVPYGLSLFHLTKVTRLPQYKDCLTGYAIFLYYTTLKLLRLTVIEAGDFQDLKLLSLNITKYCFFEMNSGQCTEYSTILVMNLSYMK